MEIVDGGIQFSANDLVNHLACRRLTELNHEVAGGLRVAPGGWDPALALLRERGLAHEQAYIEHLKDQGEQVTVIEGVGVDGGLGRLGRCNASVQRTVDELAHSHALAIACFTRRLPVSGVDERGIIHGTP